MSAPRSMVGELRPSQLLYTYGIGSVVDLPHMSVMVMGLDDWDRGYTKPIHEDRLLAEVRHRLGQQVTGLCSPPSRDDANQGYFSAHTDHDLVGVPVAPFPRWLRCPACDLLAPMVSELFRLRTVPGRPDLTKYVHTSCNRRKQPAALPARFLLACSAGHLDDFPWRWFVHHGKTGCYGLLELRELGVLGEAAEVEVRCRTCGDKRRMVEAFGKDAIQNLPPCRGRRPQLRDFDESPCKEPPCTILLGASNSWFAVTVTTMFVPRSPKDELARVVDEHWNGLLADVDELPNLRFLRKRGELGAFGAYDDDTLWKAIEDRRSASPTAERRDIKQPEWDVLSAPNPKLNSTDFLLREVAPPRRWSQWIDKVVLAERMREVTAITHFTRIASPRDHADEGELARSTTLAPISRKPPEVVPATEVRGEGIFLRFSEEAVAEWSRNHAALEGAFRAAHTAWRRRRGIEPPEAAFPGLRFVLLHTFSHCLMRELALECGYNAASIRERIYSRDDGEDQPSMAGVLLYTAAADAEGTLGGLVRMGEPRELERLVTSALENATLCSSDPLCADHRPDADGSTIHGAACHACLFAPETSCERGNKYLERLVLVPTVTGGDDAFFPLGR